MAHVIPDPERPDRLLYACRDCGQPLGEHGPPCIEPRVIPSAIDEAIGDLDAADAAVLLMRLRRTHHPAFAQARHVYYHLCRALAARVPLDDDPVAGQPDVPCAP